MSAVLTWMLLAAASTAAAQPQPQPEVTIYRSWRPPNVTLVEGMFRVDPALLGTATCSYGVELVVRDESGTELTRSNWTGECPMSGGVQAAGLETFRFNVVPARYTVTVDVFPTSQPDRRASTTVAINALEDDAVASDLILARAVALVDSADSGQWTFRRGSIGIQASSQVVVQPAQPVLGYYMELYADNDSPISGTVLGVVKRRDGRELARMTLLQFNELREPAPVAGQVRLADPESVGPGAPGSMNLPPGSYSFEMQIRLADTVIVRSQPFVVGSTAVAADDARGWFWTLTDAQIGEMFDAVVVWLTKSEADLYRGLPAEGKREFLSRQFGRGGPTPDDDDESALDAYLAREQVVRERYSEQAGRSQQAAWETDRGRIYLLRGEPMQNIKRPTPQADAPYELWIYSGRQGYVYLFIDETRLGHYRLIFSNDPAEKSWPDWENRVGAEAIEDLDRAGVRPRDAMIR